MNNEVIPSNMPNLKPLADLITAVVTYMQSKALKKRNSGKKPSNNNFDLEVVDVDESPKI